MHTKLDSDCHIETSYVNDQIPSPPSLFPNPTLPKQIINSYTSASIPQDMPCLTTATNYTNSACSKNDNSSNCNAVVDKSSPYSLWAEYFDNFPILTEFDLRAGASNSTGSSVVSSVVNSSSPSSSSEEGSWSTSPAGGSPFSDCDPHTPPDSDSPFDETSVIDEIVQTLKMDGYNFDHLGDDIIDLPSTNCQHIKQEHPDLCSQQQMCYIQQPTYASLNRPKHQHPQQPGVHLSKKPANSSCCQPPSLMNNNYLTVINCHQSPTYISVGNGVPTGTAGLTSILDEIVEGNDWSDDLCGSENINMNTGHNPSQSENIILRPPRTSIPLPPLSKYTEQDIKLLTTIIGNLNYNSFH